MIAENPDYAGNASCNRTMLTDGGGTMNTRTNDSKPSQGKDGGHDAQKQPDANVGRKQAGQTDPHHRQADRRSDETTAEHGVPEARTADSSPGNPPDDRKGTTPPDGPVEAARTRGSDPGVEATTAAEPGRGQVATADPRIDVATADSRPAPDGGTTGSDRDTLKPGV